MLLVGQRKGSWPAITSASKTFPVTAAHT